MGAEEIEKLLLDENVAGIIVHGPRETGKSYTVKYVLDNLGIKYEYFDTQDYTLDGLLDKFSLRNEFQEYLNIMKTVSPGRVTEMDVFLSMMLKKIESFREKGLVLFLDHAEAFNDSLLQVFPEFINKFVREKGGKVIVVYNDDMLGERARLVFRSIQGPGIREVIFSIPDVRVLKKIISNLGYIVPDRVVEFIHSRTGGKIGESLKILRMLEEKKYITEGMFTAIPDEKTLEEIRSLIFSRKTDIDYLDDDQKRILLYISLADGWIDAFDLPSIIQMDEDKFIEKIDYLIRHRFVEENGNSVRINGRDLPEIIISKFSSLYANSARLKLAEYMKSKGRDSEAGILYFKAGRYDDAYPLLCSGAKRHQKNGEIEKALDLFTYCSRIKYDEDVMIRILDILTLMGNYRSISEICGRLIIEHPENIYYQLRYAEALYRIGEYKKAELMFRDLLSKAVEEKHILLNYISLSRVLIAREKFDEAREILQRTLELSKKLGDSWGEAVSLRLLGNIEFSMDNIESALEYYKKSLKIIEGTQFYEDIASLYNNIANIVVDHDFDEGRKYYTMALEIAREHWYVSLLRTLYHNMSILDYYQGSIKASLEMERRAMELAISSGEYNLAVLSIMNMMDPLTKMLNMDDMEKYTEMAIDLASKIGDEFMENFFRGYRKVLKAMKGEEIEFGEELNVLRNATPMFRDYVYYLLSAMEMWKGNLVRANEIQMESIERRMNRITPDLIIDMTDLAEFLLMENFFYGKRENTIRDLIRVITGYGNYEKMEYVKWRLNIVRSILDMDENSIQVFQDSIRKFEEQGLRYLAAKMRIVFGLYYARNKGDRSILDQGLRSMGEFNLPGLLKGYSLAYSFNN